MVGGHHSIGTALGGGSFGKVENRCSQEQRRKGVEWGGVGTARAVSLQDTPQLVLLDLLLTIPGTFPPADAVPSPVERSPH